MKTDIYSSETEMYCNVAKLIVFYNKFGILVPRIICLHQGQECITQGMEDMAVVLGFVLNDTIMVIPHLDASGGRDNLEVMQD